MQRVDPKTASLMCMMILLAACQTRNAREHLPATTSSIGVSAAGVSNTPQSWGYETATAMTRRYNDTSSYCPASGPVFRCTGILFRATTNPAGTHAWDPSPESIKSGGVSFSFLRKDATFRSLAPLYSHGFVFYPYDDAPAGRTLPRVLCAFPLDAGTTGRDMAGCGKQVSFSVPAPAKSAPCQSQNITTGTQWAAHFNALGGNGDVKRHGQCGFDLGSGATAAFNATIDAMASISSWLNSLSNELRLATWNNGIGAKLPIEGFFYTSLSGLPIAQLDQKDYWNSTGIKLPVIKLTLPTGSAPARFDYVQGDQAVPPPDTGPLPVPQLKPAVVEATGSGGTLLKLDDFRNLDKVTVKVPPYAGMAAGDRARVQWQSSQPYVTAWHTVGSPGSIDFDIPRVEVVDAIGQRFNVTFDVQRQGNTDRSGALSLSVESQTLTLPAPTFNSNRNEVTVSYPGLASGHKVTVRLTGIAKRDTEEKRASGASPLVFAIPAAWIAENQGSPFFINYSVIPRTGDRREFSRYLRLGTNRAHP